MCLSIQIPSLHGSFAASPAIHPRATLSRLSESALRKSSPRQTGGTRKISRCLELEGVSCWYHQIWSVPCKNLDSLAPTKRHSPRATCPAPPHTGSAAQLDLILSVSDICPLCPLLFHLWVSCLDLQAVGRDGHESELSHTVDR